MKWFKDKRIVVPFDFSDDSVEAVKVALAMAEHQADIHVLHVVAELPANDPYVIWDDKCDQKRMDNARQGIKEKLDAIGASQVQIDVGLGKAGRVIARLAAEIDAGLIIIPSHSERGIKRMFLGSVAERVVRLAHCPVLVLKDNES